jgi:thiol-disulfide isomerase/thioredoxin
MKKQLTIAFLLFTILTFSQSFNSEITSKEKSPKLLGKINKEGLSSKNYSEWFVKNYDDYQPNSKRTNQFKKDLSQYTITMFLGTWCGDSKKEVPIFYKILDAANFPLNRLTTVAVDNNRENYKQSPGGEHEGMNIHRVPTMIFYKNGQEINRIVEHPSKSFEEDISSIINNDYVANYQIVKKTNAILNEMGVDKFNQKIKKVTKKVKPYAVKFSELNTYSSVLFYANKKEEGIAIARLNVDLYPKEDHGYVNIANKLYHSGNQEKALIFYNKALAINPTNKSAKKFLENITENVAN